MKCFTLIELQDIVEKSELLMKIAPDQEWAEAYNKIFEGSTNLKKLISQKLNEVKL